MKIGIITYFDIGNYGSILQAYAMQEILKEQGHEVVFLKVKETKWLPKYAHKLYVLTVSIMKILRYPGSYKTMKEIRKLSKESIEKLSENTKEAMKTFIDKNMHYEVVGRMELKRRAHSDEFGAFICGSDQIWSPLSLHSSSYKYLRFAPKQKRISYAPSFGVNKMPNYNKKRVKKFLYGFNYLSIREQTGKNIIKELTGLDADVVLDPTLMVPEPFWYKNSHAVDKDKYILCYFLSSPSSAEKYCIQQMVKKTGWKIKVLPYKNSLLDIPNVEFVEADPLEFVSLIRNASFVFTNSFHGCAFSIIFKKPFIVYNRQHSDVTKQTSRISSLLSIINMENRYHNQPLLYSEDYLQCNFDNVKTLLDEQRIKSLKYLFYSIKEVKEGE